MKVDIVLANIPRSDPTLTYLGTPLLKSIIQSNGFVCKTFDWNRDLYDRTENKQIFYRGDLDFNLEDRFEILWNTELRSITLEWLKEVEKYDPEWFGVTVMSQRQARLAIKIFELIREKYPHIKTIVGGFYVGMYNVWYGTKLKNEGLIDYFVNGEGDEAIVNILKGNFDFKGINSLEISDSPNLNTLPIPDFSDICHFEYDKYYTFASRGCVNNCGFCTEKEQYTKQFRFRKAELIARDMLDIKEKYNFKKILFADSLINGNPKEFKKLIRLLDGKDIKWGGQYVCTNWMTEEDYKIAFNSGLVDVAVGVESASERIRNEMGKYFSNEALYQTARWTTKNKIWFTPMFIIGWPTETEEDFQETLDFLTEISTYGYVGQVNPGLTLRLNSNMRTTQEFNIKKDSNGHWFYKDNDYKLRQDRWNRFVDHCKKVGLRVTERHRETVEENYSDIQ